MTSETVTILVSVASVVIPVLGGIGGVLAWGIRRIDARFERIDARFDRVDAEIASLKDGLTEVKIGLARLEGPRPRLIVDTR